VVAGGKKAADVALKTGNALLTAMGSLCDGRPVQRALKFAAVPDVSNAVILLA
jgi:hypothetical protein